MIKESNKKIGAWINSFISGVIYKFDSSPSRYLLGCSVQILKPQSEFFVQVPENLFGLIIGSKRRTLKATMKKSNTTIEIIEGKGFRIRRKTEKNSNAETAARDIMYRVVRLYNPLTPWIYKTRRCFLLVEICLLGSQKALGIVQKRKKICSLRCCCFASQSQSNPARFSFTNRSTGN